jgi:hypothetical protein
MAIAKNKSRVTITIGKELLGWCEDQAEELGVTVSFVIAMAIKQYKDMQVGVKLLSEVGGLNSLAAAVTEMNKKDKE